MSENSYTVKGRVCVTGGTGYLGSWMVKSLLEEGYFVNTTARMNPDSHRDISYLIDLPGATEKLQVFNADLDRPESFRAAIDGCVGVFHTAHVIDFEQKESLEVKTKKVTTAAQGILQACLESKTVRRFVYTSTISTALFSGSESTDEISWVDMNLLPSFWSAAAPYVVTKMATERIVLDLAEKHGLEVVSVLPTTITGPFICPSVPASVRVPIALLQGDENYYSFLKGASLVHVDDVARAHIHLFEHPDAKGRYLCAGVDFSIEKLSEFLSARYPEYARPIPDSWKDIVPIQTSGIPSRKLLETGFTYENGLEEMFEHAIVCCKQRGFL